jgi:spermidine synthase
VRDVGPGEEDEQSFAVVGEEVLDDREAAAGERAAGGGLDEGMHLLQPLALDLARPMVEDLGGEHDGDMLVVDATVEDEALGERAADFAVEDEQVGIEHGCIDAAASDVAQAAGAARRGRMTPREKLGEAEVPGGELLTLWRRGGDFFVSLGRNELMTSRMSGSEEALAELGCAGFPAGKRVLIGGYGMGFTLRRALAVSQAEVTVAEIVPAILEWARGPMAGLTAGCLDDPRTRVFEGDVAEAIRGAEWDAILLDVDNGPDGLSRAGNDRLYKAGGLQAARAALRPGGRLAVWSAGPDAAFAKRFAQAGFAVREHVVAARQNGKGPRHVIWVGVRQ